VPLDLFVSKATSFAELGTAPPVSLSSLPPPPRATARPEGSFWIEHPYGEPWLTVGQRGPNIVVSTSYSNRRFLRNSADMFDLALQLADGLGARVFEEVGGGEVTRANVNALLGISGPYMDRLAKTFEAVKARIETEAMAPLEYPVGPVDLVSDYFAFHVTPPRSIVADDVATALAGALGAGRVQRATPTALLVKPRETRGWIARTFGGAATPATKVLVRPDGGVQVWPSWREAFATSAPVTLEVARAVATAAGGRLELGSRACDDEFLGELTARTGGLGVDLYLWLGAPGA
jgi:hypothetical protein